MWARQSVFMNLMNKLTVNPREIRGFQESVMEAVLKSNLSNQVEVFKSRRKRLAEQMRQAGGGVAIVRTGGEVPRNRDSDFPYRWDSYFYYLTGFPEPEATLVMTVKADGTEINRLFCREKNEEREIWDGFRFGPVAACEQFGFDECHTNAEIDQKLPEFLANQPAVFYALGQSEVLDAEIRNWLGKVRQQGRAGVVAPSAALDVTHLLDEMRLYKDSTEQATMRRAADISAQAHCHAMRVAMPGAYEYEVEAELLYHFRRHGSQFPAYGSIVAGGAGACVLHYRANDQRLNDGDLLLIDAGCELDGYASDITRTFPVNGRFSAAQKDAYEVVLAAQAAAIEVTRPGQTFMAPHDAAVKVLAQGMLDLKLLSGTLDGVLENGDYKRFYMHRTGHWLGMDVHDCGDYRDNVTPPGAAEKPWRQLKPGMVLTVEPGLYIRPADGVPPAFWNIGIRIEDDAIVTPSGCEIITGGVPKTVADIEALIAHSRSGLVAA